MISIPDRPYIPFVLLTGGMIIASFFAGTVSPLMADRPGLQPWVNFAGQMLYWAILLGGMGLRLQTVGVRWGAFVSRPWRSVVRRGVELGGFLILTQMVVSAVTVTIARRLIGSEATHHWITREREAVYRLIDPDQGILPFALLFVMAVILAPIVEELFFRGYVFPVFRARLGPHAQWMSGVVFAAVHMYVINFVPIFALGWLLARGFEQTRDIRVPIVAHALVNGFVAFVTMAVG